MEAAQVEYFSMVRLMRRRRVSMTQPKVTLTSSKRLSAINFFSAIISSRVTGSETVKGRETAWMASKEADAPRRQPAPSSRITEMMSSMKMSDL
jgi:hypothetical protein